MKVDIAIIGGAGHIGLPLGLLLANKKKKIILYDKNQINLDLIEKSKLPFMEKNGLKLLKKKQKKNISYLEQKIIKKCKNNNYLHWHSS